MKAQFKFLLIHFSKLKTRHFPTTHGLDAKFAFQLNLMKSVDFQRQAPSELL